MLQLSYKQFREGKNNSDFTNARKICQGKIRVLNLHSFTLLLFLVMYHIMGLINQIFNFRVNPQIMQSNPLDNWLDLLILTNHRTD